jgi:hypothetical protein
MTLVKLLSQNPSSYAQSFAQSRVLVLDSCGQSVAMHENKGVLNGAIAPDNPQKKLTPEFFAWYELGCVPLAQSCAKVCLISIDVRCPLVKDEAGLNPLLNFHKHSKQDKRMAYLLQPYIQTRSSGYESGHQAMQRVF